MQEKIAISPDVLPYEIPPRDHVWHVVRLAGEEATRIERDLSALLQNQPIDNPSVQVPNNPIDSGKLMKIEARLELITRLVGVLKLFST
jgi:hypothetical protein